ncbi:MAG: FAD-dependent monooxygenase [Myxococcales bacterium]|nr:FAD-dependent monooxygenase [Myxococcales bacterium]
MSVARKKNPPVLVVGGGLGGLAAALSLWRKGVDYRVLERADTLVPHDAGILLENNASAVIGSLGLREEIKGLGAPVVATEVRRKDGAVLFRIDNVAGQKPYGGPAYGLRLRALAKLFADALAPEKIRTGVSVEGLDVGADGVRVRLKGGEVVEGYAVVGADGAGSVARASVFGDAGLKDAGVIVRHGVAAGEGLPELNEAREDFDGDRRFGWYPLPGGAIGWYVVERGPVGGARPGTRVDAGADLAGLTSALGGWPAPVARILAATAPALTWRSNLWTLPPLKTWVRGRVALLGEAAHPMPPNLGLNVGQVLEDAVVLGQQLAEASGVEDGFARYNEARVKRAHWVSEQALQLAGVPSGGGLLRSVRAAWWDKRPASMQTAWEAKLLTPPIKRLG